MRKLDVAHKRVELPSGSGEIQRYRYPVPRNAGTGGSVAFRGAPLGAAYPAVAWKRTSLSGGKAQSISMQENALHSEFDWKPAEDKRTRIAVLILSTIAAVCCITAGFVLGRVTDPAHIARGGDTSLAVSPTPNVSSQKQPDGGAPVAPVATTPPVVLLNPGTATTAKQDNPKSASIAPSVESEARLEAPQNRSPDALARSSGAGEAPERPYATARDYRELRDYMLGR